MPKTVTASLSAFDGKSEKFEDNFRNKIKMYPHLTEKPKIKSSHSLLRGDGLKAFRNLDDSGKEESIEERMAAFKRRLFRRLPVHGESTLQMGCAQMRTYNATTTRLAGHTAENGQNLLGLKLNSLLARPYTQISQTTSNRY